MFYAAAMHNTSSNMHVQHCITAPKRPHHVNAGAKGRKVLHVQSISRWAPSCIGPYSQATTLGTLLHMAGQIALDPPTMQLVPGGLKSQLIR